MEMQIWGDLLKISKRQSEDWEVIKQYFILGEKEAVKS